MSPAALSQLLIYPIKSSVALSLSHSLVQEHGLAFDRRFVVSDMHGRFMTARTHPKLNLVQCALSPDGLYISAPAMPTLGLHYRHFSQNYSTVSVWSSDINAQHCSAHADAWLSEFLGQPCQLLYFGEQSERFVKRRQSQVAFADGYPLLLISQASLDDLNARSSAVHSMLQFRPNVVVDNTAAFAEDGWKRIRIGEVDFEIVKPSTRCHFTSIIPGTLEVHPAQEPLSTLARYRKDEKGEINFGQNMVALNQGLIHVGMPVEVLEAQVAVRYPDEAASTSKPETKPLKALRVNFQPQGPSFMGNNAQSLLEQVENAGFKLPYACRAGVCGRCKVKLLSGKVDAPQTSGLSEQDKAQGYVLACRCIPQSDVAFEHASIHL